jgi:hypothetical protein
MLEQSVRIGVVLFAFLSVHAMLPFSPAKGATPQTVMLLAGLGWLYIMPPVAAVRSWVPRSENPDEPERAETPRGWRRWLLLIVVAVGGFSLALFGTIKGVALIGPLSTFHRFGVAIAAGTLVHAFSWGLVAYRYRHADLLR